MPAGQAKQAINAGKPKFIGPVIIGVAIVSAVFLVLIIVTSIGVSRLRDERRREEKLTEIGNAMLLFENNTGKLPRAMPVFWPDPNDAGELGSNLSWRVHLLPYLGQTSLYNRFKHDEPWDSQHNLQLLKEMPEVYRLPGESAETTLTYYRVFVGPLTIWDEPHRVPTTRHIYDGSSNTILIVEASDRVPWTKPEELVYRSDDRLPAIGLPGREIVFTIFADGSIRKFRKGVSPDILRRNVTASAGEIIHESLMPR